MYAYLPSGEDSTSCGSGPAGTRPTIFRDAGSTIASVLSLFSRMSKAGDGVCASTQLVATKHAARKRQNVSRPKIKRDLNLIATPILAARVWRALARLGEEAILCV